MADAVLLGDCFEVLQTLDECGVDACVTDPPYGLGLMGKHWDKGVPDLDIWREVYRVLKPGAHLLSFFGTRTYHRGVVAIEDAGFEIRDQIGWLYGSGFPKSLNVGKKVDGWDGWGTALKPAWEPIVVARKPFKGTVAANVLEYGTGGINVDACRVEYASNADKGSATPQGRCTAKGGALAGKVQNDRARVEFERPEQKGRFPANVIHDGSDEALAEFPNDAARFFYCAKASKKERGAANNHPTVKPIALMRYLVRLVTPPDGVVLDPFAGSGTTLVAATLEHFRYIGIEQEEAYHQTAIDRLADLQVQKPLHV